MALGSLATYGKITEECLSPQFGYTPQHSLRPHVEEGGKGRTSCRALQRPQRTMHKRAITQRIFSISMEGGSKNACLTEFQNGEEPPPTPVCVPPLPSQDNSVYCNGQAPVPPFVLGAGVQQAPHSLSPVHFSGLRHLALT